MKKINRRSFLRLSLVGAGALGVAPQFLSLAKGVAALTVGSSVSSTTGRERIAVPTTCTNCGTSCGLLGFLESGRLVKIEGNPEHPNNRGRICAKGIAWLNEIYDPDRLLYPLKRTRQRGEGAWKRISWEEALSELSQKLAGLIRAGRREGLIIQTSSVNDSGLVLRFAHAFATPNLIIRKVPFGLNKEKAIDVTFGHSQDMPDLARTRYILNFGANPYESHFSANAGQRIVSARQNNRAKLVTFDPRLSNTAGRSDQWLPLAPGTDGIVALAMANVIMKRGLADREFLATRTNYSVEGLRRHLARYTPESAEKESGVSAADIQRLALEFATTKPATTLSGGGVVRHSNGVFNERCIALLNIVTGNVQKPGGYCLSPAFTLKEPGPSPRPPALPEKGPLLSTLDAIERFEAGELNPEVYLIHAVNPVFSSPAREKVREFLKDKKKVPYLVVADSHLTETAALADLVLPRAVSAEELNLTANLGWDFKPLISLSQPLAEPPGQVRPFADICLELAKKLGGDTARYLPFAKPEEYYFALANSLSDLKSQGGLDHLREKGFWSDSSRPPSYDELRFPTPSGRIEVYSSRLKAEGFPPLPQYMPVASHGERGEDEFVLISFKVNVQGHSRTQNDKWLSEIYHDNPLLIHPQPAARRGIADGDSVKLISAQGEVITKARLTEGIHPQAVGLSFHGGHWEFGRVARATPFASSDPDSRLLWWRGEGNGANANSIIPPRVDPVGGGEAAMDTVVKVVRNE